jgi:hypothetical protein
VHAFETACAQATANVERDDDYLNFPWPMGNPGNSNAARGINHYLLFAEYSLIDI